MRLSLLETPCPLPKFQRAGAHEEKKKVGQLMERWRMAGRCFEMGEIMEAREEVKSAECRALSL